MSEVEATALAQTLETFLKKTSISHMPVGDLVLKAFRAATVAVCGPAAVILRLVSVLDAASEIKTALDSLRARR